MHEGAQPGPPHTNAFPTEGEPRICYRCGTPEAAERPLRLLPGSTHIVVCPACYQVLWGWKAQKDKKR